MFRQFARHRFDPLDHAAFEVPRPEFFFPSRRRFSPSRRADLGVDAAVGDDLDIAVGEQEIDQDAVVVGRVPRFRNLREDIERAFPAPAGSETAARRGARLPPRSEAGRNAWPRPPWSQPRSPPAHLAGNSGATTNDGGEDACRCDRCPCLCLPDVYFLPTSRRAAATKTAAPRPPLSLELLLSLETAASAAPGSSGPGTVVAPAAAAAAASARALIGRRQDLGNQRHHEDHHAGQKRSRERSRDVPGQRADDTAGDGRRRAARRAICA